MDIKDFVHFLKDFVFEFFHEYVKIRNERDDLRTQVATLESTIQGMKSERNLYPYKLEDRDKEIARLEGEVKEYETGREELFNVCLKTIRQLPKQLILYTVRDRAVHAWSVGNDGFPTHARLLAEHDDVEVVAYYVQQDWQEVDDEGQGEDTGRG